MSWLQWKFLERNFTSKRWSLLNLTKLVQCKLILRIAVYMLQIIVIVIRHFIAPRFQLRQHGNHRWRRTHRNKINIQKTNPRNRNRKRLRISKRRVLGEEWKQNGQKEVKNFLISYYMAFNVMKNIWSYNFCQIIIQSSLTIIRSR